MRTGLYFGRFSGYNEYYAFGTTPEKVKQTLWLMYANALEVNGYEIDTTTFADFENELRIQKFAGFDLAQGFGFTDYNIEKLYKVNPLNNNQVVSDRGHFIE